MRDIRTLLMTVAPFAFLGSILSLLGYLIFQKVGVNDHFDDAKLSKKRKKRDQPGADQEDDPLIGMVNYGNTCFFNALLQALAACSNFRMQLRKQRSATMNWLCRNHYPENVSESHVTERLLRLLHLLAPSFEDSSSFTDVATNEEGVVKPAYLLSLLTKGLDGVNEQQDAHELFLVLMLALKSEIDQLNMYNQSPILNDHSLVEVSPLRTKLFTERENDCEQEDGVEGVIQCGDHPSLEIVQEKSSKCKSLQYTEYFSHRSILQPMLSNAILQCDVMQCFQCGARRASGLQHEACLILHLPSSRPPDYCPLPNAVTLDQLLRESFQSHVMTSATLDCPRCEKRTAQCKYTRLLRQPATLCILLQRIGYLPHTWPPGHPVKLQDPVHFPLHLNLRRLLQGIDLSVWREHAETDVVLNGVVNLNESDKKDGSNDSTEDDDQETLYELKSVLVHYGSEVNSGHYAVYRRISPTITTRWGFFSDEVAREVSLMEVLEAQPYMLFYERR